MVRTPQSGCIIISEPDPHPGALLGHMTFGGFNPAIEQIQVWHTADSYAFVPPGTHQDSSAFPALLSARQLSNKVLCNVQVHCKGCKELSHLYEGGVLEARLSCR